LTPFFGGSALRASPADLLLKLPAPGLFPPVRHAEWLWKTGESRAIRWRSGKRIIAAITAA